MKEKKILAIEMLAQGSMTYKQIAEELDINVLTLRRWRQDPDFAASVMKRAQELLKDELPSIFNVLANNAKTGSPQHIKMVLDYITKLEEIKHIAEQGSVTFTWGQQHEQS